MPTPLTARRPLARRRGGQAGQASVELLATVPAVLVVGMLVWQLALAGHAAWACANAARVAARAHIVGRDAGAAARSALPRHLRHGLRVDDSREDGAVRVRVRVPLLVPGHAGPVSVSAAAALGGRR